MRNLIFLVCSLSSGYSLLQSNSTATPLLPVLHGGQSGGNVAAGNSTLGKGKSLTSNQSEIDLQKDNRVNITNGKALEYKYSEELSEGRGRYKRRKMMKYLQPILVSILVIKFILVPLTLKALTALSTSSFVMSKIALATAGIFVLKWLLTNSGDGGGYDGGAKERIEIVHLPLPLMKPYHRGNNGGWEDLSLSGSNNIFEISPTYKRHKYIPVGGGSGSVKDVAHMLAIAATENDGGGGYHSTRPQSYNYNSGIDGKPFL